MLRKSLLRSNTRCSVGLSCSKHAAIFKYQILAPDWSTAITNFPRPTMNNIGYENCFSAKLKSFSTRKFLFFQIINYGRCLLIPKYFCAVCDYAGRADLSKGYWNPKRKLGVTVWKVWIACHPAWRC